MIKLTDITLKVKKIRQGRYGDFCVADLSTEIGDFKVKDPLLDQFEDGDYTGTVWISEIYLAQYIAWGKGVTEIRARLHDLQLDGVKARSPDTELTLWDGLQGHFAQSRGACRPPLRDLTPWHLALALAAGQVVGKIQSATGRTFLIKGDTFKRKERQVSVDVDDKGNASQTTVMLDRFVPVINAIELTPDHRLGQIVKIA